MKRIVSLLCLVMLWTGIASASPQWEVLDSNGYMVDMNSIKTIQVDYNEIIKANAKENTPSGGHALYTLMINKDTKERCMAVMEFYDSKGALGTTYTLNPKNPKNWNNGNREVVEAIINRLP